MKRFLIFISRHPAWVFSAVLFISVVAVSQLGKLEIDVSPRSLALETDPEKVFYDNAVATFGSDDITVLYVHDSNLFDAAKLELLRSVIASLSELPFIERIQSLFTMPDLRVVDDSVITDPFLKQIPGTPEQVTAFLTATQKNPFTARNLISSDGRSMAVNLYHPKLSDRPPGYDSEVAAQIEKRLEPLKGHFDEVFQIGLPYIRSSVRERIDKDQRSILPLSVGVLLVTLLLLLRRPRTSLVPLLTAGVSVLWLLGLLAGLGIPLSVMTAVVPVLMVIIGSTEDIHLITEFYAGLRQGRVRTAAIRHMARRMALAVLLTFLTSLLGFLSVATNPIELVREFGIVASLGLALNFIATVLIVPAYLQAFAERRHHEGPLRLASLAGWPTALLGRVALPNKKLVFGMTSIIILGCGYFALSVNVNNSILNYFDPDSEVTHRVNTMHERLSGLETLSIVVDGHIDDAFTKTKYLRELSKIQAFVNEYPAFDSSMSFANYVALLNSAANDNGEAVLPEEDYIVNELLLFLRHRDVAEYVSADFSKATIVVRHGISTSLGLKQALRDLRAFIDGNIDKDLDVHVTGDSVLTNNAANFMVMGQTYSLLLMVAVILVAVSLLFANARAGIIATVPNIFLVVVLFGVMGYFGIPLDTATAMIAAIALGVCVDHTMHFMVRYHDNLKKSKDEKEAIVATIREESLPISAASIALAAGLGSLTFSTFTPISNFGALTALVMILAFFANFFITPQLLLHTHLVTLWDVLSIPVRRDLLTGSQIFKGMRRDQIKRIVLVGKACSFRAGEEIMRVGEQSKELFIILSGRVRVYSGSIEASNVGSHLQRPGDVFGVVALVCGRDRIATAVAEVDANVISLDWDRVRQLSKYYPRTAALFFRNLTSIIGDRFRQTQVCNGTAAGEARTQADWGVTQTDSNHRVLQPVSTEQSSSVRFSEGPQCGQAGSTVG